MDGSSNILRRRACFPTNETNNKEEEGSSAVDSTTNYSNSTVQINPPLPGPTDTEEKLTKKKKMKKKVAVDVSALTSSSLSSSSIASSQRGTRVEYKRRNPRVRVRRNGGGVDAIGHPLGISVAAVMALVLYGKDTADERMSTDHLSSICTSAVRESLANVFGDKLDGFTRNFEQSFGSTLRTIRSINDSSVNKEGFENNNIKKDILTSECVLDEGDHTRDSTREDDHSKATLQTSHSSQNRSHNRSNTSEEVKENILMDSVSHELALPGQTNQVVCFSPISPGSVMDNHMVTTFEKSVMEQTRCNDLKTLEIGLAMKKLNLKETQLALNFDSNHLERSKLAMGISKASFKAEKFRNQLEDMRHADLLRNCLDCLVTGLLVMSSSLSYGAYVYSYERITEATASCIPSAKESNSWWYPKSVASFNSGWHMIKCKVLVVSRMLFGVGMIISIAYLLLQRSTTSKRIMPVTFIILLLGVACGFAGKLCVDTLGGSGYTWLIYWEILCVLHFLPNVCTSALFSFLYGPVTASQRTKSSITCPYWIRWVSFYAFLLLFLPLLCGLTPFASLGEWKDHCLVKVREIIAGE